MKKKTSVKKGKKKINFGCGIIDKLIDKSSGREYHIPGYKLVIYTFLLLLNKIKFMFQNYFNVSYCGPGTNLELRVDKLNQNGINPLDEACKAHDIFYRNTKNSSDRNQADEKLKQAAIGRMFSRDAKFSERATAGMVAAAMKGKKALYALGAGQKKSKQGMKNGKWFFCLKNINKKILMNKKHRSTKSKRNI